MKITAWVHVTKTIGVAITPERIENMKCPKCGKEVNRLLALSRADNKTMICDKCGTKEALDAAGLTEGSSIRKSILACVGRGSTPQERVRAKVQATGNKWAVENFNANPDYDPDVENNSETIMERTPVPFNMANVTLKLYAIE